MHQYIASAEKRATSSQTEHRELDCVVYKVHVVYIFYLDMKNVGEMDEIFLFSLFVFGIFEIWRKKGI